ncbi:P-II family nitrogen regulator [Salirhabdus sp. Marseille-P4669]|uniref:P-II family nitrogen regulator n=1 Tax=Salirhabdus sp. Marseille-P4669 TaxID=2042310 RepID=UPI000C7C2A7D|nr:P-II family nitrogen regulator [Salirhabdus sp. Marseille-P4669]
MKKIEAIIRPEKFPLLRKKLGDTGINGLTVTEAAGCGLQEGQTGVFRGNKYEINLFPKIKVEMVVTDDKVDPIITVIQAVCSNGNVGDGKIFIIPVENAIRIRTGESGLEAISS